MNDAELIDVFNRLQDAEANEADLAKDLRAATAIRTALATSLIAELRNRGLSRAVIGPHLLTLRNEARGPMDLIVEDVEHITWTPQ